VDRPLVSVIVASSRVLALLPRCLESLALQKDAPSFEVLVASALAPAPLSGAPFSLTWIAVEDRNPALRRNRAARQARGSILAFVDDDAEAEPGWLAAGVAALERCAIAGGPDLLRDGAPWSERLSDLLLATPWIGSGVPAHERAPRGGPVAAAHDVTLCNLFARRGVRFPPGFDESPATSPRTRISSAGRSRRARASSSIPRSACAIAGGSFRWNTSRSAGGTA
jgi:glycosyltransferase involved in cell wall biosynthesis